MAVAQVVLLFRSKTRVLTPWLDKSLEGFHHWAARRMAVMGLKIKWDWTWVYLPIGVVLAIVGPEETGVYTDRLQNTVVQYIVTRHIMDLCLAA